MRNGAEPRLVGLAQAAPLRMRDVAVSEPETAVRVTLVGQNAGAAQRHPRCSASS
jgi:hypothetical protein